MTPEEKQHVGKLIGDAREQWLEFAAVIAAALPEHNGTEIAKAIRDVMDKPEQTLELSTEDTQKGA